MEIVKWNPCSIWLQIVLRKLILNGCMDMLFSRMEKILGSPTPWRNFTPMCLEGAFTMDALFRGCARRQFLFQSISFSLSWKIDIAFSSIIFVNLLNNKSSNHYDFILPMIIMPSLSIIFSVRLEQGTVTSLLEENGTIKGVQYKTKTGQELTAYAPLTIVCDGCFSNLRRSLCTPKVCSLSI